MDVKYEGFGELEEAGFEVDSVTFYKTDRTYRPAFSLEYLVESGFLGNGKTVRYLGRNGYDSHRKHAVDSGITEDMILTVKTCHVGGWSSDYTFYEIPGRFNTVMFEEIIHE